ncbi:MAG TPA: hypothetical protein VHW24_28670, partial [Bryobacteraceae bacterium]|nr:hypothetical protein [Bryobacteraceae bacterium]
MGQTPVQDDITSAGASVTFNAVTHYAATDPAWLTINAQASTDSLTGLTTPTSLFIRTGGAAGLLSSGTHNATITLTATDGSGLTASIAVTFTTGSFTGVGAVITPSPTSISVPITYQGSTQVTETLTTTSAGQVTFTLLSTVPWITVSQISGNQNAVSSVLPAVFTITLSGIGQAQAQLNGALTLTPSQGAAVSIPVILGNGVSVGPGGGGGTSAGSLTVSQNPVTMTYVAGSGVFPSATVNVNGNNQTTYFATVTQATNNWLLIQNQTNLQFSVPNTLTLSADSNAASLTPGTTYQATVALTGNDGSSLTLNVNLVVTGANTSGITVAPNPIALSAPVNGSTVSQTVTITSANAGNLSVSVTGSGLSVSNPSVTSLSAGQSTTVTVFASPANLNNNTYSGTLFVNVGGGSYTDPVSFTVGTGSGGGTTSSTVVAAPSTLNFTYENGGNMQPSQSANIFLGGSGNYTAAATTQSGSNWLSISNQGGTLPASFYTIVANAAGLVAGQYQGTVTFTNTTDGSTSSVAVSLNVTNTTAIYSNPVSLIFNAAGGSASPQSLTILSSDGTTVPISVAVSTQTNASWLSVTGGGGTTQSGTYQVSVNAANLTNGVYTGYITAAANTGNSPITIPVALSVTGSTGSGGGTGSLTLGQSSLTFNVPTGSTTASTQQLAITAASPVTFTASAATNGVGNTTWLTISP